MIQLLMDNGADLHLTNLEGDTALDLAIMRMSYDSALFLKLQGLEVKDVSVYSGRLAVEFDIELFLEKLDKEEKIEGTGIFFEKIKKAEAEWAAKDLILDPRETFKQKIKRHWKFEEPPLVPREEVPEDLQPHKSFYGKVNQLINGYNPYPPGHKWNKGKGEKAEEKKGPVEGEVSKAVLNEHNPNISEVTPVQPDEEVKQAPEKSNFDTQGLSIIQDGESDSDSLSSEAPEDKENLQMVMKSDGTPAIEVENKM